MRRRHARRATLALCAAMACLLVGCAAPTGDERASIWNDGYGWSSKPLGDDEHSVTVRGNALTSSARAAQLALLRAARLTLEHGRARFVVLDQETLQRKQDQFRNEAMTSGGTTIAIPAERRTTREPVSVLLLRLLPDDAPPTAGELDARALVAELEAALADSDATPTTASR